MSRQTESHPRELLFEQVFDPFAAEFAVQTAGIDVLALMEPPTCTDEPAVELVERYIEVCKKAAVTAVDQALGETALRAFIEFREYAYLTDEEKQVLTENPTLETAKAALTIKLPRNVEFGGVEAILWEHGTAEHIRQKRPDLYTRRTLGDMLLRTNFITVFANMHDIESSRLTRALVEPAETHGLDTSFSDILLGKLGIPPDRFRVVSSPRKVRVVLDGLPPHEELPEGEYAAFCPATRTENPSAAPDRRGKRPNVMVQFEKQINEVYICAVTRAGWLPA